MYGVDLSVQFENLMPAIGLGFVLGMVYDVFRFIRQIFSNGKIIVFITDMIFVLVCTLSSFLLFLAVNSGRIRGYLIVFEVLAATIYRFTAGRLIFFILSKTSGFINSVFSEIFSVVKVPLKSMYTFIFKVSKRLEKNLKKSKINSENPLKDVSEL
jgi:spore cortex biosynthesis protein YabQ